MKVLLTGANGQLGKELIEVFSSEHQVFPCSKQELDVTDAEKVYELIAEIRPDIVIHTAACTRVDELEENPDKAFLINSLGTKNIALASKAVDAQLVYISTAYVFDGQQSSVNELSIPNPINKYGESKLKGEQYVQEILQKHYIIRTSWLYGRKYIKNLVQSSTENQLVRIPNDQFGTPTNARELSQMILSFIEDENYGIYHVTNKGSCSKYDYLKTLIKELELNINLLPIHSQEISSPALRPTYAVLENRTSKLRGYRELNDWKESLKDFVRLEMSYFREGQK